MAKLNSVIFFVAGAAIGSVATWLGTRNYYERITQEEIDSVKEVFSKRAEKTETEEQDEEEPSEDKSKKEVDPEYMKHVDMLDYTYYTSQKSEETTMATDVPYVISPVEFGSCDEYSLTTLMYCKDKVLIDEDLEPVDDIEELIGKDSLDHFGEYEDDTVYVRNDARMCDYEIVLDTRKYADICEDRPHTREIL